MQRALCLECRTIVQTDEKVNHAKCRCPNATTVNEHDVEGRQLKHIMKLDSSGLARPLVPVKNLRVENLTSKFKSLLDSSLRLYNWADEQVAVIHPCKQHLDVQNGAQVGEFTDSVWPIPVLDVKLSDKWVVNIDGVKKDDAIIAPDFLATRLVADGYTRVYSPDDSQLSLVVDKKTEQRLGVRRLTRFHV